jgi:hypothetical protein
MGSGPQKPEDVAMASIKNKMKAASKKVAENSVKGFDPVTDTYTGKDEGPKPEYAEEKHETPAEKDVIVAHEDGKQSPSNETKPEIASEAYKRAMLAAELADDMVKKGHIDESQKKDELARLLKLSSDDFKKLYMKVSQASGAPNEFVVEGEFADINTLWMN